MRPRLFRPGFDLTVERAPGDLYRQLEALIAPGAPFAGRCVEGHVMLTVIEAERHFWSPYLHVQIVAHRDEREEPEPQRSYLRGFFTPHPSLWSSFVFGYLALSVLVFFSGIWGLVQITLGKAPTAGYVSLACAVVMATLHVASVWGRRRAAEQMGVLESRVRDVAG
jgi:hypothetical protein